MKMLIRIHSHMLRCRSTSSSRILGTCAGWTELTWVGVGGSRTYRQIKTARIKTANGYNLTVTGSLAVVDHLMQNPVQGGAYTPARLVGPELVTRLPGSGPLRLQ